MQARKTLTRMKGVRKVSKEGKIERSLVAA